MTADAPAAAIRAPIDLQRLRRTLDARYVLHGTVDVERGRTRLTVELTEAETGRVLWSDPCVRPLDDMAAVSIAAAQRIAAAVPPVLVQRELDRAVLLHPGGLFVQDRAWQACAMILRPERTTFPAAAALLRQAGSTAAPHGGARFASVCWHLMAITQGWFADPAAETRAAAAAAERLDEADPASMALRAHVRSVLHGDHAEACTVLGRIIDSAPLCGIAWSLKALTLSQMGEGTEAVFHAGQAAGMPAPGPDLAWRDHVAALASYVAGDYAEAARWARASARQHPGLAANARVHATSLAVLGRLDEAQRAANRVLAIDPHFRIAAWRRRSFFTDDCRERYAQRLRLAGLPE
jgi:tetratricopeptide (TPR) repeat protein